MNTYLVIITTVLVITQIVRITQNAISLHRQNKEIRRNIKWIDEREIKAEDFDMQRKFYQMAVEWLEEQEVRK